MASVDEPISVVPPSPGVSAGARLYRLVLEAGSAVNRLVVPSPTRLGRPLPAAAAAAVSMRARPVVLVGGYASSPASLQALARSLRADGFRHVYIFTVPSSGIADVRWSASELGRFVDAVRERTGAARVDVVAHSAGGVVSRTWAQGQGGAAVVERIITIASPHHGVRLLGSRLANAVADSAAGRWLLGPSTHQLLAGSRVVTQLHEQWGDLAPSQLVSIYVDGYDGLLSPLDTAVVAGAGNVRLLHPGRSVRQARLGHYTLHRRSDAVYEAVRVALLGAGRASAGVRSRRVG